MDERSKILFEQAKKFIPGGVNSPVRAGKSVGMEPLFINRAEGCYLWDEEGRRYIDYVCSWGPMILGHSHPAVLKAIQEKLPLGTSFGAPTAIEVEMAEAIIQMVPSIEMVRMVNSGTEAAMSAVRLARGYTGRNIILKFEGCYHGHADSLLVEAGSGVATLGIPGSPGIPAEIAGLTISLPYNNIDNLKDAFKRYGNDIAAIIVEPVAANMGVILPDAGFLTGLRNITKENGALLIFDEVITGLRLSPGGAQGYYNIMPDITCLGKIIGGGLPVGAYGGRRDIMQKIAPEGNIYQAGTLSGNPIAMAAGLATLKLLKDSGIYKGLEAGGNRLFTGLKDAAIKAGINIVINHIGSLGSLFFTGEPVIDFRSAKKSDAALFRAFYRKMREKGIYLAPSPFEAMFLSIAHDNDVIDRTIDAAYHCFSDIKK
ncbi:MAG: glutamate-1-semialdehyde 2,1-aminomutase [Deltaproteobacteria bacterium]|nr:glutamate-1-semialdehyde 2,1-aminomutase [Deltaproteobacteria bacterium]